MLRLCSGGEADDSLYPIAVLIGELKHEDSGVRLNSMRRLGTIGSTHPLFPRLLRFGALTLPLHVAAATALFPDPRTQKRRFRKRRMLTGEFLLTLSDILGNGGTFSASTV